MSEKFIVNSCCCGCTLKTGSLIIGILYLIISLGGTIQYGYAAVATHHGILWFSAVVYVIQLIAACLLIHGTRTENASLVRVWVYVQAVVTILQVISLIIVAVSAFTIGGIISGLIMIGLCIYFIVVVRSYALELESGGGNPA